MRLVRYGRPGKEKPGLFDEITQRLLAEATRHRIVDAEAAARIVQGGEGFGDVAAQRSGEHDRGAVRGQDAGDSAGSQQSACGPAALGWIVDELKHAVAEDGVGAFGFKHVEHRGQIALRGPHRIGNPGFGGPALKRGQGVRARIDHGDPVAEPGQRDREASGAAADVDDVERLGSR